jgi:nucleoside-diphosphate-sugar epimerase
VRIAVTGAAGRFGRHVVARALRAGHEVVAIDLPAALPAENGTVEWRPADLVVIEEARSALAGAAAVVHLGAIPGARALPEPQVHHINVASTYNVLLAAEEHGVSAVCTASSVNAIGGIFSERPRYDRFPVDEEHPTYCEDPYGLSKWIGEQQSASFARRQPDVPFSALRLHALRDDYADALRPPEEDESRRRDLWGWVSFESAAAAALLTLHRRQPGHSVYNIVATRTMSGTPSAELARRWYPQVPVADLPGTASFYATHKALAELGWDARDEHPAISDGERSASPVAS